MFKLRQLFPREKVTLFNPEVESQSEAEELGEASAPPVSATLHGRTGGVVSEIEQGFWPCGKLLIWTWRKSQGILASR